jgi:predicted nucleic acid-binding protein
MGLLVDSGVFILCERRARPLDLTSWNDYQPFRISAITVSELLLGVYRADSPSRRANRSRIVEKVISTIPIKAFDEKAARVHAEVQAELFHRGTLIGAHDLLIAATALAHGDAGIDDKYQRFRARPQSARSRFRVRLTTVFCRSNHW